MEPEVSFTYSLVPYKHNRLIFETGMRCVLWEVGTERHN